MTQKERDRLVALKKAKKKLITRKEAAAEIGVCERQVRRTPRSLKERGDKAVIHAARARPPLRSFTRINLLSKAKPSEKTSLDFLNRGLAAVYSGANSIASALHPLDGRDPAENQSHFNPELPAAASKPDISTLQRIGRFYFALTVLGVEQRNAVNPPRLEVEGNRRFETPHLSICYQPPKCRNTAGHAFSADLPFMILY